MEKRVFHTIQKHQLIAPGDRVLVGVSGGADSVCLLHLLHSFADELAMDVMAIHINHGLRGEESDEDQEYVKALCAQLGIPLYIRFADIRSLSAREGLSIEEAGREARYRQFAEIAQAESAAGVAVAHHKDDQAETILMRIIRGTGLEGLKGIEYKRGNIIRPLLDIDRKEIEAYCIRHNLCPRTDSSNLDNLYTRNKIRLQLIPFINQQFETDITSALVKMAAIVKEDNDYLHEEAQKHYEESVTSRSSSRIRMDLKKMMDLHPAVQRRLIRNAIGELKGDLKGIENVHIEKVMGLAANGRTGALVHLPDSLRAARSYGELVIYYLQDQKPGWKDAEYVEPLIVPGQTKIKELDAAVQAVIGDKPSVCVKAIQQADNALVQFFDYEKLKKGISIRSRRSGDVFKPLNSNGSKKFKEYLIDRKIPREDRDKIPLVVMENQVVWMIGYKISDKFKVTENTKRVLQLKYEKMV